MTILRNRWAGLLGAGALTLTLAACGGDDDAPAPEPTGTVSEDTGASTEDTGASTEDAGAATGDAAAEETGTTQGGSADAAEGEDVDIQEFLAMLQSPGEETLSSYTMTMAVNMGGQAMDMEGAVDLGGDDPALNMDMMMPGMGAISMVMVDGRVFMQMPGVTEEGMYMEVPPEQLGDLSGQLDEVDITSTWDAWEEGAQSVVFVGEEDVDGQDMRRYTVTVDTEAAMDAAGQTGEDAAQASAMMGDELTYDVWIDDENLMRKITFELDGAVTEMTADNWGEPQDIQPPSDDEIQDAPMGTTDS